VAVKVVMFFVLDKYSWTEDHYWLGAGGSGALAQAIPIAQQLASYRVQLLGYDAQIERIRLSNVPANQQVDDVEYTGALTPSWELPFGTPAYTASRAYNALLLRIQSVSGYHRNYYLGGAPAGLFHSRAGDDTGLDFSQVPSFLVRMLGFMNYLTSGPWGWLTRTQSPLFQASGLVTNAAFPGMLGITVAGQLAGVVQGSQIQVKGWRRTSVKASPPLTGVYRVGGVLSPTAPSTLWTYFLVNSSLLPPSNFFTLGQVGPYVPSFQAYNNSQPVEATSRKRGATSLRPRGRSRTQF
jgi:hypothetical protein